MYSEATQIEVSKYRYSLFYFILFFSDKKKTNSVRCHQD